MKNEYSGNLSGFLTFVGPKMANLVSNTFRSKKKGHSCQAAEIEMDKCLVRTLQVSHYEVTRPQVIERILEDYQQEDDFYVVDLQEFEIKFKEYHTQPNVVYFLCDSCHRKYENTLKNKISTIAKKEIKKLNLPENTNIAISNKGKIGWAFNIPINKINKPYRLFLKENQNIIQELNINFLEPRFKGLKVRSDRNSFVIMLTKSSGNFVDKSTSVIF